MLIHDERCSFEIGLREMGAAGTQSAGDLGITVRATNAAGYTGGPFTGSNATVWINRDQWATFLNDLREVERTRQGEARVTAMSPAEFHLAMAATDRAGHLSAEGWVGREYAGRGDGWYDRVCFSIQLDPSRFRLLVAEFEAIAFG